jgi:hypothetical protein
MSKDKSDNEYLIEDLEFQIKAMKESMVDIGTENRILKEIIKLNDLESEIDGICLVSDEEKICIRGIEYLAKLFDSGDFTKDDAQTYDILHKNLRMIRGLSSDQKQKKIKPQSKAELLSIVNAKK